MQRGAGLSALAGLLATGMSCSRGEEPAPETGLEALALTELQPRTLVPGTSIKLTGRSFLDEPLGLSSLHLVGNLGGLPIDAKLPARFVDFDEMTVELSDATLALLGGGEGDLSGTAAVEVIFAPEASVHESFPLPISVSLRRELEPELDEGTISSPALVNDLVEVEGDGILLGGNEGETFAVVEGCFEVEDSGECLPVAETTVLVESVDGLDRTRGTFRLSPAIVGIDPGTFRGSFHLRNELEGGASTESGSVDLDVDLQLPVVSDVSAGASLGGYLDFEGGGFIGGEDGVTLLRLDGTFVNDGGIPVPLDGLELIPEQSEGRQARYVLTEEDALGLEIDLRSDTGRFEGSIRPVLLFQGEEREGLANDLTFELQPVKQVVWVRFQPAFVESLRKFGIRALDQAIRDRALAVIERDYAGINLEVRTEEPLDYALYSVIDIGGPDLNGQGLLGYDNTPGKDVNNDRLFDHIGGQSVHMQPDGFPGFGGVFVESMFTFSFHPPDGGLAGTQANLNFDAIFDPFRPDTGEPVRSEDVFGGVAAPASGAACPGFDRATQIQCAVWALGSMVGSTASHELGHSLGLASPYGSEDQFHNSGDAPNRLMDAGGSRSFEERAEIMGLGPASFCREAYEYLRIILPTDGPSDGVDRVSCSPQ